MKRVLPLFALLFAYQLAHAEPLASQTRNVPAFRSIELAGTMAVEVTVGKPLSVVVSGEADLLDKVITTVKDGRLVIDTRDTHRRGSDHLIARVSVPDLSAAVLSGTGKLQVTGVANARLELELSGTGALKVTGSTDALQVNLDGTGEIAAKNLTARDAVVALGGTGHASLRATDSIQAKVTGTGAVDVYGRPQVVKKSVSGLGNIKIH